MCIHYDSDININLSQMTGYNTTASPNKNAGQKAFRCRVDNLSKHAFCETTLQCPCIFLFFKLDSIFPLSVPDKYFGDLLHSHALLQAATNLHASLR